MSFESLFGGATPVLTVGIVTSFLGMTKNFTMQINNASQQLSMISMAMAGADRIFKLLDEEPEVDDGYVTLVNIEKDGEEIKSKKIFRRFVYEQNEQLGIG